MCLEARCERFLFFFQSSSDFSPSVPRLMHRVGEACRSLQRIFNQWFKSTCFFHLAARGDRFPCFPSWDYNQQDAASRSWALVCYPWPAQSAAPSHSFSRKMSEQMLTWFGGHFWCFEAPSSICNSAPSLWRNELCMGPCFWPLLWGGVPHALSSSGSAPEPSHISIFFAGSRSPSVCLCAPLAAPCSVWQREQKCDNYRPPKWMFTSKTQLFGWFLVRSLASLGWSSS